MLCFFWPTNHMKVVDVFFQIKDFKIFNNHKENYSCSSSLCLFVSFLVHFFGIIKSIWFDFCWPIFHSYLWLLFFLVIWCDNQIKIDNNENVFKKKPLIIIFKLPLHCRLIYFHFDSQKKKFLLFFFHFISIWFDSIQFFSSLIWIWWGWWWWLKYCNLISSFQLSYTVSFSNIVPTSFLIEFFFSIRSVKKSFFFFCFNLFMKSECDGSSKYIFFSL